MQLHRQKRVHPLPTGRHLSRGIVSEVGGLRGLPDDARTGVVTSAKYLAHHRALQVGLDRIFAIHDIGDSIVTTGNGPPTGSEEGKSQDEMTESLAAEGDGGSADLSERAYRGNHGYQTMEAHTTSYL